MSKYVDITDSYKHVLAEVEGHVWEVEIDTDPSYGETVVSAHLWSLHKGFWGGYSKTKDNIVSASFIYDPKDKEELTEKLTKLSIEASEVLSELPNPPKGTHFCVNPLRNSLNLIDDETSKRVDINYSKDSIPLKAQKLIESLNIKLHGDVDKVNKFR